MNGPLDDAMEGLARDVQRQERLAKKRVAFQELAVKALLRHFHLMQEEARLRELCYDQTGERHLLFSWFMHAHLDFPVWLGARNVPVEAVNQYRKRSYRRPTAPGAAHPITRCGLFRSLDDLRQGAPPGWGLPVGLVFRRWHHGRPLKVLHTAEVPIRGWRDQVRVETTEGPEVVTLEDFETFLQALRWSP